MNNQRVYYESIRELIDKLNYHTKCYDEGHPEISDKEWDDYYFKLLELEGITGIREEDSPTQRVIYSVMNNLQKVKHNHLMLSLDKTKSIDEIRSFIGDKSYIAMGKMDGLTCSLTYRDGVLIKAETRGNGEIGEDILHNAFVVKNIPKRINFTESDLTVDGEIICTDENFKSFAEEYKNSRNFASGSIRLLDSKECARRNLSFIAWDVFGDEYRDDFLSEKLYDLQALGFEIVPYISSNLKYDTKGFAKIENVIEELKQDCAKYGYPIDGLVFKYNTTDEYEAAGRTDHHFKGGLAYKFYDEEYETTLDHLEWTMGRTGVLTPVAILEPIDIDGSVVARASLHNISVMYNTLHGSGWAGQKVKVAKMNMIIPQIVWAEEKERENIPLDVPIVCPICGHPTEIIKEIDSEMLYCANPQCEGKLVNRIEHFFGKKGLDAKGISKATISKLIDLGWVTRIADMFDLSRYANEWKSLPGFGEKSVSNILGSIDACRNCDLESAIAGIGIPLIGRTVAKDLANRFTTYATFKENIKGDFDFSTIGGYGYEMNKSLKTFNYNELDYIVENYLMIEEKSENKQEQKLEGLTFVVTGKVKVWKNRDELSAEITTLGGKVAGSVSKNTNYLINNDVESTSAKNNKAKELGIKIIDEQTFMSMFDIKK